MDFIKATTNIEKISDSVIRNIAELLMEALRTYPKKLVSVEAFINEIKLLLRVDLISKDLIMAYLNDLSKEYESEDTIFWLKDSLSALADALDLSEMRGYNIEDIMRLIEEPQ